MRVFANRSSGRQGTEIALALIAHGAQVTFVTGPASVEPPAGAEIVRVETAEEMLHAVERALPVDAALFAAAVADWKMQFVAKQKIKKTSGQPPVIQLVENPDILRAVASRSTGRPKLVIGFAAETDNVVKNAITKRHNKGCDWIIANDVSEESGILGGSENQPIIITAEGEEHWPRMSKAEFARQLAERIAEALQVP